MGIKRVLTKFFVEETGVLNKDKVRKGRIGILAALAVGIAAYTGIDDGLILGILEQIAGVFQ